MIPPVESLVKYDKPVLVSSSREKDKAKGKKETVGVDSKGKALQTEDILNAILPPRCDVWAALARIWDGVRGLQAPATHRTAPVRMRTLPVGADPLCVCAPGSGPRTANCGFSLCQRSRRRDRMPFLWGSDWTSACS